MLDVALGIGAPLVVAVLWGRFAAPRSEHRLPDGPRRAFELAVFAVAAAALIGAGQTALGIVLAVVAVGVEAAGA